MVFSIRVSDFHELVEKHAVSLLTEPYGSPHTLHVLWDVFFSKPDVKTPHKPTPSLCREQIYGYNLNSTAFPLCISQEWNKLKQDNCVPGIL